MSFNQIIKLKTVYRTQKLGLRSDLNLKLKVYWFFHFQFLLLCTIQLFGKLRLFEVYARFEIIYIMFTSHVHT